MYRQLKTLEQNMYLSDAENVWNAENKNPEGDK